MDRAAYLQKHRDRREQILEAVRAGTPYRVIAEARGVTTARVAQLAKKAGIARRQLAGK